MTLATVARLPLISTMSPTAAPIATMSSGSMRAMFRPTSLGPASATFRMVWTCFFDSLWVFTGAMIPPFCFFVILTVFHQSLNGWHPNSEFQISCVFRRLSTMSAGKNDSTLCVIPRNKIPIRPGRSDSSIRLPM